MAIVQYRDQDATTPAPPGGHERPALRGPGSPGGKGRIVGLVVGAVVVVSLVAVALAAAVAITGPLVAVAIRHCCARRAYQQAPECHADNRCARRSDDCPGHSTAVPPRSTRSRPERTAYATPSTISPSVTAGTAVPWSPTSPKTLVGGNGDPKDWPAAGAKPPSLAGAYGDNMIRVIVTLSAYQDWLYAHPNPALVKNYVLFGSSAYPAVIERRQPARPKRLASGAGPREIEWAAVSLAPKRFVNRQGRQAAAAHGHKF